MTIFFDPFRRPLTLLTVASWVSLLLFESGMITRLTPATAQQRLPAPPDPLIYQLPPPLPSSVPTFNSPAPATPPSVPASPSSVPTTPSSVPTFNTPTPALPQVSPNAPPVGREYNFQAPVQPLRPNRPNRPNRPDRATQTSELYRVDIVGDSSLLLARVQQLEPEAFVRRGEGVIQAGVFSDELNARSRVSALEAQGIRARIIPITGGIDEDTIGRRRYPGDRNDRADRDELARRRRGDYSDSSYFVAIPGETRELPNIATEVVRLGVRRSSVAQRESPRGPHVAIGPFDSRTEADRWSSYFRSVGMDARVYFDR